MGPSRWRAQSLRRGERALLHLPTSPQCSNDTASCRPPTHIQMQCGSSHASYAQPTPWLTLQLPRELPVVPSPYPYMCPCSPQPSKQGKGEQAWSNILVPRPQHVPFCSSHGARLMEPVAV